MESEVEGLGVLEHGRNKGGVILCVDMKMELVRLNIGEASGETTSRWWWWLVWCMKLKSGPYGCNISQNCVDAPEDGSKRLVEEGEG